MKKLLFSAILMIAFSVSSFASEKKSSVTETESFKNEASASNVNSSDAIVQETLTECDTYRKSQTFVSADEDGEMVLTFVYYTLVVCDDGFSMVIW